MEMQKGRVPMTDTMTLMDYQKVAPKFDNHDPAHLLDAYLAGLASETLEFLAEARQVFAAVTLREADLVEFSLESGDVLWNMTMLMTWFGYDYESPLYREVFQGQTTFGTRSSSALIEHIEACIAKMMNTRERMLRVGSTIDLTKQLKFTHVRLFHAWVELNYRAGFTIEYIADCNVRKLCERYSFDYSALIAEINGK